MVKGKSKPIDAVSVGPVIGSSALSTASGLPFLGRETELDLLVRAGATAAGGDGQFVEIVGEPGSKSASSSRSRLEEMTQLGERRDVRLRPPISRSGLRL
jgi:hypothetical protein